MMNSMRSLLTRETLTYLIKYLLLLPYPSHKHKLRLSLGYKIRKILIKKHFWFHWVKILVVLGLLILSMELSAFCLFYVTDMRTGALGRLDALSLDYVTHMLSFLQFRWRPYRVQCTGSLLASEVKWHRARLVLGWGGCLGRP